ncbi:hypothetical protein ACRRVD_00320 [Candidatus Cardinium hertigii]|uniref:hypothetical protein n=1 Tax=Candidatus Cardinium hertigii TaxID=247481 RepID=UPI003D7EEAFD
MVYKKIGNKIPSLSSLLLAGVLLGSNCSKGKDDPAREQSIKNTEQSSEKQKTKDGGAGATHGSNFIAANKEIKKIFFRALGLDYLPLDAQSKSANQGRVLSLSDNDFSTKKNILDLVKRLAQSFSNNANAYPLDLRENIAALGPINESFIKERPRAFGLAINEIANVRNGLANVATQMWEKIDQGAGDAAFKDLKEKSLDPLSETLKPGSTKFKPGYKFSDASDAKLLDGAQLARFLTDLDKKGQPRGNTSGIGRSYQIPNALNKTLSVCIKNKQGKDASKKNTLADLSFIGSRGSGLGEDASNLLLLQGNEGKLPFVNPLPNGTLQYRYQQQDLINYAESAIGSDINKVFDQNAGQFGSNGIKNESISFGTLLFTLFRGNTPNDFLELTCDKNNAIVLKGIDANFKKWVNQSDDQVAAMLHQHISSQSDLQDLFFIPNLQDLYNKVLPASNLPDNDPALKEVCINILSMLGMTADPSDDLVNNLLPEIDLVAHLANNQYENILNSSDVDFNQRFCISLAKQISTLTSNRNSDPTSLNLTKSQLVQIIKSHANNLASTAVVKIGEDGQACATTVTAFIKSNLDYVYQKLKDKHTNANRTYADITSKAPKFDVEQIRSVYEKECNKLGSILLTSLVSLLDKQENITEDDLKQIHGLKAEEIDQINKIKQSYQAKQTKK